MWNGLMAAVLVVLFLNGLYAKVQSSSNTEGTFEEFLDQEHQTQDKSQECPTYLSDMTSDRGNTCGHPTASSTLSGEGTAPSQDSHRPDDVIRSATRDEDKTRSEYPVDSSSADETTEFEDASSASPAGGIVEEDQNKDNHADQPAEEPVITEPEQTKEPAQPLQHAETQDEDIPEDKATAEPVQPAEGTDSPDEGEADVKTSDTIEVDISPEAEEERAGADEPMDSREKETAPAAVESPEEDDLVAHKDDDMPSFDEWKRRMLEQEEREKKQNNNGQTGQPVLTQGLKTQKGRHNYGSVECGAKILSANREVQHSSSVLVENKDMYMLNPCSAKVWFIVELCEPIQLKQIDIANFELFSSVPESFKVSTSERYPAREWQLLGTFHMANERTIQSFPLDEKLFNKYLKVEMVSHYGSEHYCPLSLFRAFGTSMEEEIEETEQHSEPVGEADDDLFPDESVPLSPDSNLFGSAKDAVLNIVKQAAKVFTGPSDGMTSTEPHETEGTASVEQTILEPTLEYPEPCLDRNRTVNVSVPDHDGSGEDSRNIQPTPTTSAHSTDKVMEMSEDQTPPLSSLPLDSSLHEDAKSVQDKTSIQPTARLEDGSQELREDLNTLPNPVNEKISQGIVTLVESGIVEGGTDSVVHPQEREMPAIQQCPTCAELHALQMCQGNSLCLFYQLVHHKSCEEEEDIPAGQVQAHASAADNEGRPSSPDVEADEKGEDVERSEKIEPHAPEVEPAMVDTANGDDTAQLPADSQNDTSVKLMPVTETGAGMATKSPTIQNGHDSSHPDMVNDGEGEEHSELPTRASMDQLEGSESTLATLEEPERVDPTRSLSIEKDSSEDGSETLEADGSQGSSESEPVAGVSETVSLQNEETKQVQDQDKLQVKDIEPVNEDIVSSVSPNQSSQEPSIPESAPAVPNGSIDALDKQGKNASDFYAEKNENGTAQHISHGGHMGKESVIMRLNNRIKALELNMSLSSRYLEELSQRYRKQMDEMQKAFNKTISKLTNNSRKAEERDIRQQEIIATLQASITNLTTDIQSLTTDRENLHRKVIERHMFLMVVEVLCLSVVFVVCVHTRPGLRTQLRNGQREELQKNPHGKMDHVGYKSRTASSLENLSPQRQDGEERKFVIVEPQCAKQGKGTDGTKKKRSKKKHTHQALRSTSSTPNLAVDMTVNQETAAGLDMNVAGLLFSSSSAQEGKSACSTTHKCAEETVTTPQHTTHQPDVSKTTRPTLHTTQGHQQTMRMENDSNKHVESCQQTAIDKVFLCCSKTSSSVQQPTKEKKLFSVLKSLTK